MLKNKKGFTLMELVVSTAIMGTLAAFAVPSYIEAGNNSKATKSLDNINNIGAAILQAYNRVLTYGVSPNAIATFTYTNGAGTAGELEDDDGIINYYDGTATKTIYFGVSGTETSGRIIAAMFPGGVPESPFGGNYTIVIGAAGAAVWESSGGVKLKVTQIPQLTITDPSQNSITGTFSP